MRITKYLGALILSCLAFHSALAQSDGNYNVTESWSVTLYRGSANVARTFTGKETGTLGITNGSYTQINRTGAVIPANLNTTMTINYDGTYYNISGAYPFSAFASGPGGSYAVIQLSFFVIKVPLGSQSDIPNPYPYDSSVFTTTGTSLTILSGAGTMVDQAAAYGPVGPSYFVNEVDASSTSSLNLPVVAPTITTPPVSQVVEAGSDVSFFVGASGSPSFTYQWKHGGTKLSDSGEFNGTATSTLNINNAQARDAGDYTVVVSDSKGSSSASVTLTVDTTQPFTNLSSFTGGSAGAHPAAGVILTGNTLYGTADYGGASSNGTVFAVNTDGTGFTNLHSFTELFTNSMGIYTNSDGARPESSLVLSGNTLYGTASAGGPSGYGTVFAVNTDGTSFTTLYGFTNGNDGAVPAAGLALSGNTLYGTASAGGASGNGTVFAVSTHGMDFTSLYSFTNGNDGANPYAGLILSGNTLYGTASAGGASGNGTVFAVNTNGSGFTTLYSFTATLPYPGPYFNSDGANPYAGLVLSGNTLYGTASAGGSSGDGTVFAVNTNGTGFTNLYNFTALDTGTDTTNSDGANPYAGLILSGNTLYGTADSGGSSGGGTVFKVNTDGTGFTTWYNFTGGSDGYAPEAGLILSGNTLYGTAYDGGTNGNGTVFSLYVGAASVTQGSLQVTVSTSPSAGGIASGSGTFASGSSETVTATANSGYSFVNWTENGSIVSSSASYNFTLNANQALVANFAIKVNPKLTISSPKSGQSVSNALLVVTGTVTDKVAVDDVYYQLNGGIWTLATPGNSWSNWTASGALIPGANTISAYAVDASGGISPTNTVAFKFIPSATLILQINGNGTVTPNDNGKLLVIGNSYTLKAIPSANNLFSNWVGGTTLPYAVLSTSNSYTFAMQSNLVLEANFVPNPFLPEQGVFNGLFLDTNGVTEASSGFFTLALTKSGAFTGKILTSGSTYSLPTTKRFDVGGQVEFMIPTKPNTLTVNLQLDISDPAGEQITGTVSDGTWTAGLTADRAVFSATTNKAVNYEGQYTLAIAGSDDPATSPGGFGWATLSISSAGLITMKGNLADGTAMSQSVSVSKDGRWPFYTSYASPPAGNGGTVFGWITFSNQPASALGGTMYWFRPAGKTPAVYQSGFTNMVTAIGSAYNPTNKPLLDLTNGQVTLDGGNLLLPITNQITLSANNTITLTAAPENTNKLALVITTKTGLISGSFQNPTNAKQSIKVKGVLLQNQTNAAGYFLGPNQSGALLLEHP